MLVFTPWLSLMLLTIPTMASVNNTGARVLIFSATKGCALRRNVAGCSTERHNDVNSYRHDSIPTAINSLRAHSASNNIAFEATEDASQFTNENLARYDALLFLSTTDSAREEVLGATEKQAFQNYLDSGGNFVAIHSASDSLTNTTFYKQEIGWSPRP